MKRTLSLAVRRSSVAVAPLAASRPSASAPGFSRDEGHQYKVPRTAWGDPDLQGVWPSTDMVGVPLQRASNFGERNLLTDEEFKARQAAVRQAERRRQRGVQHRRGDARAGSARRGRRPGVTAAALARTRQAVLSGLAHRRSAGRPACRRRRRKPRSGCSRSATPAAARGPADSYEDRSLYDQCITRGVLGSILPVIYNNGNQIIQAPGLVVLRNEMIHETRFFYLDGRPHISSKIRSYMGDSRARWDGDTLVVETTNMFDRNGVGGNGGGQPFSDALKLTERFTRVDADTLMYRATIDDPKTYTRPFTIEFPWRRDSSYGFFEYACHEGNHALLNILSGARADDAAAGK